jgi:hypothetical protein
MSESLDELSTSLTVRTEELARAVTKLSKELRVLAEEIENATKASRNRN